MRSAFYFTALSQSHIMFNWQCFISVVSCNWQIYSSKEKVQLSCDSISLHEYTDHTTKRAWNKSFKTGLLQFNSIVWTALHLLYTGHSQQTAAACHLALGLSKAQQTKAKNDKLLQRFAYYMSTMHNVPILLL